MICTTSNQQAIYMPWVLLAFNILLGGEYVLCYAVLCCVVCVCAYVIVYLYAVFSPCCACADNASGSEELVGIFCGHVYYFLKYRYPVDHGGPAILETPAFM
jgi:hypothetical protein